jgi:hypothetical protein
MSCGDPDTLDDALSAARAALAAARPGTPDHSLRLSNLGPILRSRYDRNGGTGPIAITADYLETVIVRN